MLEHSSWESSGLIINIRISAAGYYMRLGQKSNFLKLKSTPSGMTSYKPMVGTQAAGGFKNTTVRLECKYHFLTEKRSEVQGRKDP